MIEFLTAAILYLATYLSFVQLLKYPRNRCFPTMAASAAMVCLSTVTVVFVSVSSVGLDIVTLSVSTGFIVGLFSIIAAPAINFWSGSRPAHEFVAKHGDFAGLWMLPPAIVAGYAVPDAGLHGIMAAAMIIESTWFLRHRWDSHQRRLHAISGNDLNVLDTQAKGDIEGFARRHGIRELVLSKGAVGWLGCSKKTHPCPFNLYVHRLGLNTAPCCREHMKELCHYVASCLRDMGAVHWLDGGNLLGAVREGGKLLEWEDDVDVSVLLAGDITWKSLVASFSKLSAHDGYYVDALKKREKITISYDPPGSWPFRWERNRMRSEIKLDLAIYRYAVSHGKPVLERRVQRHYKSIPLTETGGYGLPREIVLPTSTILYLGADIACPNRPEAYLRILFGDFKEIKYTYMDVAAAQRRRGAARAPERTQPRTETRKSTLSPPNR